MEFRSSEGLELRVLDMLDGWSVIAGSDVDLHVPLFLFLDCLG